jgi:hypothetical protein
MPQLRRTRRQVEGVASAMAESRRRSGRVADVAGGRIQDHGVHASHRCGRVEGTIRAAPDLDRILKEGERIGIEGHRPLVPDPEDVVEEARFVEPAEAGMAGLDLLERRLA